MCLCVCVCVCVRKGESMDDDEHSPQSFWLKPWGKVDGKEIGKVQSQEVNGTINIRAMERARERARETGKGNVSSSHVAAAGRPTGQTMLDSIDAHFARSRSHALWAPVPSQIQTGTILPPPRNELH